LNAFNIGIIFEIRGKRIESIREIKIEEYEIEYELDSSE
jgi:hypothetical protein